jgi:uncharacterized protein (TIGR03437 family)
MCLAVCATVLQAINGPAVFVLPNGAGGTLSGAVGVYQADPFQSYGISTILAAPQAYRAFTNPSGSQYYILANSGSATVSVFDGGLGTSSPITQLSLGTQPVGAAMAVAPNYVRLLVLTADGNLHIIDSASDTAVATLAVGSNPADVAVALDGSRAFVLAGGQLLAVDLTLNQIVSGAIPVGGQLASVQVGPNGLVYAAAINQVLVVDGRTMTQKATISLNAMPGKLVFTPDGLHALTINQTPVTGSSVLLLDLVSNVVASFVSNFVTMTKVVVVYNPLDYALGIPNPAFPTEYIYQLPLSNDSFGTVGAPSFNTIASPAGVTDLAVSNEYAIGNGTGAHYLYLTTLYNSANTVYRVDNTGATATVSYLTANSAGAVAYVAPAATGTPANIIAYNTSQTVAPGALALPLVVRVVDANGKPLNGVPVTFSSSSGAIIQTPSTTTNVNGIALTSVTAPSVAAVVPVFATASGLSATFTLTVTSSSSGTSPSGGTGAANVQISSGNGQVVPQNFSTAQPLAVLVTDANGNPLVGQTVTWISVANPTTGVSGNAVIATSASVTDTTGTAICTVFGAPFANSFTGYDQTTINASIYTGASVNFTVTTIANRLDPSTGQYDLPGSMGAGVLQPPQTNRSITGGAGQTLPAAIQVQVYNSVGQPIPGVGISASTGLTAATGPTVACNGPGGTALSNANGIASCDLILGNKTGTAAITVNIGGQLSAGPINLTVTPGAPGQMLIIQGNNQSGNPGQTLPSALKAQVLDVSGNILSGVAVKWTVVSGTATLSNVVSTSDPNGYVSALVTLGTSAGTVQISVSAVNSNATATFTETVNVQLGALTAVSGGSQSVHTGQAFPLPLIVQLTDTKGNPLPGLAVSFVVTSGSASVNPASATTNAQGQAQTSVTAGSTAGTVVVTASVGGLSASFTLTVIPPGPNVTSGGFLNDAGFQPGVVPGGLVYISGTGLAPGLQGSIVANPLVGAWPTALNNVTVTFGSTPAPIFAVSNISGQESVIVQCPFETLTGSSQVTITVGGGSTTLSVPVLPFQPGIFEDVASNGKRYAVVMRPDGSFVSTSNPAQRGETVQVYVTGLGPVSPSTGTDKAGTGQESVVNPILVGLNNAGVNPISAQYAQGLIGVYVVTFQIPASSATGTLPLAVAEGPSSALVFGNSSLIVVQ